MKTDSSRPIAVDLFSGAGGLSLGFEQAGFDVKAAVEIDPVHAAVHSFNFPNCEVLARSVTELSGQLIRDSAGLGGEKVSVVFGGAPCQGFSLIGQRALEDPRNKLVKDFVRIVGELDADFFVFENVKGLTLGKHRKFLDELIAEFEDLGYLVRKDWRVLNACNFGVPQDRQRLFLMGARRGLPTPAYPQPLTACPDDTTSALPSAPTCADALGDLPNAESFRSLLDWDEVRTKQWGSPTSYAQEMRCTSDKHWHFGYKRCWDASLLTASMRTDHSEVSRRRFSETEPGTVEPISRFFKLAEDGISNTLRAGTDSSRGAFTSPRPIHYKWNRCITVREMARLHGFPDWFRFNETKWHGARQIGNAVPPPLARAIARQVMHCIGSKPIRPSGVLALGDTSLLRMSTVQAAAYWGIPNPINNRDRKSGARKRKQSEIESSLALF